jgi:hypothetical protein
LIVLLNFAYIISQIVENKKTNLFYIASKLGAPDLFPDRDQKKLLEADSAK